MTLGKNYFAGQACGIRGRHYVGNVRREWFEVRPGALLNGSAMMWRLLPKQEREDGCRINPGPHGRLPDAPGPKREAFMRPRYGPRAQSGAERARRLQLRRRRRKVPIELITKIPGSDKLPGSEHYLAVEPKSLVRGGEYTSYDLFTHLAAEDRERNRLVQADCFYWEVAIGERRSTLRSTSYSRCTLAARTGKRVPTSRISRPTTTSYRENCGGYPQPCGGSTRCCTRRRSR